MINLKLPPNTFFLAKGLVFIFIFFFLGNALYAQNIIVPERIQAALLSKVLKYNPQISLNKEIKILVVYDTSVRNSKDEFVSGLDNSMNIKAINPNEIEQNIANANVVYFMTEVQNANALCKKYKVLSVSGTSKDVEHGDISLGFVIQNSKPIIVVNLTSLDREGQSFSSDILRISKIYK